MKKSALTGTVIALMSIGQAGTALAAGNDDAHQAAFQAIVDQQVIDEQELQKHGQEYLTTFLASYEQGVKDYRQAYRHGIADGLNRQYHPQTGNQVGQIGYQRGYERGQQLGASKTDQANQTSDSLLGPTIDNNSNQHASSSTSASSDSMISDSDQRYYAHQDLTPNQAKFINRIARPAQQVGKEYDLYPSIIIAQAALESNWGCSDLGRAPYFNLFGVKGYFAGQTTNKPTTEYDNAGQQLQLNDNFRSYQNETEALRDYAETLNDPLYTGVHRQNTKNYREATRALRGKYATDPYYDQKLNQLIDAYQLTKYDEPIKNTNNSVTRSVSTVKTAFPNEPKHQIRKKQPRSSSTSHFLPILGGVGSVGIVELLRKWWLLK